MRASILPLFLHVQAIFAARKVLLMRHCPRAPGPFKNGRFPKEFPALNNYSHLKFPSAQAWGAAANQCTPVGFRAIASYGSLLQEFFGKVHGITADNTKRTIDTANALAKELSLGKSIDIDGSLFSPVKEGICRDLSKEQKTKCLNDQLASVQLPFGGESLSDRLQALQRLLGRGIAPELSSISSNVTDGKFVGGAYLASEIIETFNLEFASGLPMAWGKITEDELYTRYLGLHGYYFEVSHGGVAIAQRAASAVLAETARLLHLGGEGSQIFVAHDTTLAGVVGLLGLKAQCVPSLLHGAPPLSGLLFEVHEQNDVRVEFISPVREGASDIHRCPVAVSPWSLEPVGVPRVFFERLVSQVIDRECVKEGIVVV